MINLSINFNNVLHTVTVYNLEMVVVNIALNSMFNVT